MPVLFGTRTPFRNIERILKKQKVDLDEKKEEEPEKPMILLKIDYSELTYGTNKSRKIENFEFGMADIEM
jgi:hypothetical protein